MIKFLIGAFVLILLVTIFLAQRKPMEETNLPVTSETESMLEENETTSTEVEMMSDSTEMDTAGEADLKEAEGETMSDKSEVKAEPAPKETTLATGFTWKTYVKPDVSVLKATMDPLAFKVTQEEGTERAGTHPYDKLYDRGIYVDILSGEPLFSSRDKYDSRTGWPSWTAPISNSAVTEHEDRKLFSVRTEIRSAIADNHIGHVFDDGPKDKGGLRYCMNGVALRFVPEAEMEAEGYGEWLTSL